MTLRLFRALGLIGLVSISLPGPAAAQPAPTGDLYVLAIGVEPTLSSKGKFDIYAQDAQFVADAMAAAKPLFRKVEPTVVSGKQATRKNVLAALEKLKTQVREQDVAVVFFSSHGGYEADSGYTIWVANGPKGKEQTLSGAELLAATSAVPGKVIVMLDTCCAAGAIPPRPKKDALNVAFITACRKEESSFGQSDDKNKPHGYFVIAVCEALKGLADQNKDGVVTVGEIEAYVTKRATALCGEQHAVSRTPPTLAGFALALVEKNQKPTTVYDFDGKRNPFGLPDIDRPLGKDVQAFSTKTRVPGANDDENAQAWNKRPLQGKADTMEGNWEYRWKGGSAGDTWVSGVAQVKIANERVFILCRDRTSKYMIEGRLDKTGRVVGRYVNLNDPADSTPFVARSVTAERIDGYWTDGRWDLRRTLAKE